MAYEEHLRILKEGVTTWNQWREKHPGVRPGLSFANLHEQRFRYPNPRRLSLGGAQLSGANLSGADLSGADLGGAGLSRADLSEADLSEADLSAADLIGADLRQADLWQADLSGANLGEANLQKTNLSGASLTDANLIRADFSEAIVDWTVFGAVDLSGVKGLESVVHKGPSTIGIDTVYASRGRIPEAFLRGCGVPDEVIASVRSWARSAIEYYSCFISYSSKDQAFAERLHADLQAKGVRCWFAPEDMKTGDKIWERLDQSIRLHDKLLVILSDNFVGSTWVGDEVMTAFEEERRRHKTVLFPVRLDDAVMGSGEAWAGLVRQRHIGDFRGWKEHDAYRVGFERLMRDLKAEG